MIEIIAQILGIIAMLFNILSFQCKKNKSLVLTLGAGSLLFSLNYLLLGAFAGAGFNFINIIRTIVLLKKKTKATPALLIICLMYAAVAVYAYEGVWTLVLLSAQIVATLAFWGDNGAFIRKIQFFYISPVWLLNNIFVTFTIGGIICEAFTIISVIISFIRFGKKGFE